MNLSIEKEVSEQLGPPIKAIQSKLNQILPELFVEEFGIIDTIDQKKFYEAFKVCTEGQGKELKNINKGVSSALLPLLTFFRLFGESPGYSLKIKLERENGNTDIEFDRCFFEVRNEVITIPSCVDIALYSTKSKVLLFLESKLSEYCRIKADLEINKGYIELYNDVEFVNILEQANVKVDNNTLKLFSGKKAYFEGIKQSICHLIGLVQGPSKRKGGYYPDKYRETYENCYTEAKIIYYATIILDPEKIGANGAIDAYKKYVELYKNTIGAKGSRIIDCIRKWPKLKVNREKEIKVLPNPLSYHEVFENTNLLLGKVVEFYNFSNQKTTVENP